MSRAFIFPVLSSRVATIAAIAHDGNGPNGLDLRQARPSLSQYLTLDRLLRRDAAGRPRVTDGYISESTCGHARPPAGTLLTVNLQDKRARE
jgi:hypothetical protein